MNVNVNLKATEEEAPGLEAYPAPGTDSGIR